MAVKTYTRIQKTGIAEGTDPTMMAYGYGLYVNAFVVDTDFEVPEAGIDGEQGIYATECIPFDADKDRISRARRRVRQNARNRYLAELDSS
jgi:hypothetical protein